MIKALAQDLLIDRFIRANHCILWAKGFIKVIMELPQIMLSPPVAPD